MLSKKGYVIVGLLSPKALKGYKKERVPFRDRKIILEAVLPKAKGRIVQQDSLNPEAVAKKYKCTAIASGDGWEEKELKTIQKLGLKVINLNSREKLHSSHI